MTRDEARKYLEMKVSAMEKLGDTLGPEYEAFKIAISVLHGPTREQVERMRGEWVKTSEYMPIFGCSKCGERNLFRNGDNVFSNFCPACEAPMTDEAVDMILERWKELYEKA